MKLQPNIAIDTDVYKLGHWKAINPGVDGMKAYMEPRVGAKYEKLCFFGLSMIIQDHFTEALTEQQIKKAERRAKLSVDRDDMFNLEVWKKVQKLGYLPIRIKAVKEGTWVDNGNVLMTYEATEPWFAKAANTIEGTMMHTRYTTDICSRSGRMKKAILPSFEKSSDLTQFVLPIAVNDFGYRGTSCWQQSYRGGAAHLVHFIGSDNIPGMEAVELYYGMKDRLKSVWATEHSVQLSFPTDIEYVLYQLKTAALDQIVSSVMDGRDQDAFAREIICHPEVVELVKLRAAAGGITVWRPDTGKPLLNLCKYSDVIGATYGFTLNSKGYKKLSFGNVLLQGDGINENSGPELYKEYIKTGWTADNAILGSGGGLLQEDTSRDLNRWAIKPCYMDINGVRTNVAKKPKSDMSKASKEGDLKLHSLGRGKFMTIESSKESPHQFAAYADSLEIVFENGQHNMISFNEIVKLAENF